MFGTVVKSPGTVNSFYCLHSLHSKCIFICVAVAVYLYLYLLSLQLELFSQRVQNNLIPLRHFSIPLLPFRLAHLQCDSSIFYRGFFSLFMFWFFYFAGAGSVKNAFCCQFLLKAAAVLHMQRGGRGRETATFITFVVCVCCAQFDFIPFLLLLCVCV